jgi:nucleoid DNA-binding protein
MAVAKKKAPVAKKSKNLAIDKPMTKTEMIRTLVEHTELKKAQVVSVLESITEIIDAHLNKKGPGELNFLGMMKISIVKKAATKARKGVNPFTGEETTFKAKPASRKVKIKALKTLKDIAS